jgi:DNA-binding GntR family transcriptional regulator
VDSDDGFMRTTLTDVLISRLRDEIRQGVLEPGSRLRQHEVAERFDTSTTPVREAFQALEREGLVVIHPHRGVIVFQPSVDDLVETYEIRIRIEALATEKAVPNMTPEDIDELAGILCSMKAAIGAPGEYGQLNARYHYAIYRPAGRPKLQKLIEALREASAAYLRFYAAITPSAEELHREHTEIYEACKARDAGRAADAVARHLQHTVDYVSAALRDV